QTGYDFARQSASCNSHGGFTCRRTATTAIVPQAIFHIISVIGMARTVARRNLAIVFRALVHVFDQHRDRRSRGYQCLAILIGQDAGEYAHFIRLATLRHETRFARTAAVKLCLNIAEFEANTGRAAVNDAAYGWTMAFPPGCDAKEMPVGGVRR